MDKVQEANNLKYFHSYKFADFQLKLLSKQRSVPFNLLFLAFYPHEQNIQMYHLTYLLHGAESFLRS